MCVHVHIVGVCMHACVCMCVCVHVRVCSLCMYVCLLKCVYVCGYACVCVSDNTRSYALIFFLFCSTVTFIFTLNVYILIFHLLCFSVQISHDLPGEACGEALQRADAAQVV